MKKEIKQLIERLAGKSLTFGCVIKDLERGTSHKIAPEVVDVGPDSLDIGGDPCCCGNIYPRARFEILGHPVTMLDVLEKIGARKELEVMGNYHDQMMLMDHWRPFGFKTSLNQILENTEWVNLRTCLSCKAKVSKEYCFAGAYSPCCDVSCYEKEVPKDPNTKALFQFLLTLGL